MISPKSRVLATTGTHFPYEILIQTSRGERGTTHKSTWHRSGGLAVRYRVVYTSHHEDGGTRQIFLRAMPPFELTTHGGDFGLSPLSFHWVQPDLPCETENSYIPSWSTIPPAEPIIGPNRRISAPRCPRTQSLTFEIVFVGSTIANH